MNKVLEDIKRDGKISQVKSILQTTYGHDSNNKQHYSFKGRESSSSRDEIEYGRKSEKVVRVDRVEVDRRERSGRDGSGDSESGSASGQGNLIKSSLQTLKNNARRNRGNNAHDSKGRANRDDGRIPFGESTSNGIGDSKKGGGNNGELKYSRKITAEMSDSERAEILKDKVLVAPIYEGQADTVIESVKRDYEREKKENDRGPQDARSDKIIADSLHRSVKYSIAQILSFVNSGKEKGRINFAVRKRHTSTNKHNKENK